MTENGPQNNKLFSVEWIYQWARVCERDLCVKAVRCQCTQLTH